jgi:anti-anti-sigma regulatory factor
MNPVQLVHQDDEIHLLFNAVLNISQARTLHALLGQVLTQPMTLVLDAGQVEQVDTASMQILAGFCRHRREQNAPIRWRAVSPAVQQASHLLGLDSLLGNPA